MTSQGSKRFVNAEYADRLEAEVAQVRQDREKWVTEAERLVVVIGDQAERLLEAGKHAGKLEAARDHLRAQLQQVIEQWEAKSQAYTVRKISADVSNDRAGAWRFEALDEAFEACAADLLAILTEPEEKK